VPLGSAPRAFLLVGVLGGFTTFSSYAFESFWLLRDGHVAAASLNIVGQVVLGLAGVAIGFALAR
jgi:CrcB protein